MRPNYIIGLDLAQSADYTGLVTLQRHETVDGPARYDAIVLERWRGLSYMAVPARVRQAERALQIAARDQRFVRTGRDCALWDACDITLVVDASGVGAAVIDVLADAGLSPVPIIITGGFTVHPRDEGGYTVPKANLVAVVEVMLQGRRLQIADDLPHAHTLVSELRNFRYDHTASGRLRYGAGPTGGEDISWRGDGSHDDLLLATALAAWYGETHIPPGLDVALSGAFLDLPPW